MKHNTIAERLAAGFHALSEGLKPHEAEHATEGFVRVLKEKHLGALAPKIVESLERLAEKKTGVVRVHVTTSEPMPEPMREKLADTFSKAIGAPVKVEWKEDPSIVGGAVVRYDDVHLDASVRGRLERLRSALSSR